MVVGSGGDGVALTESRNHGHPVVLACLEQIRGSNLLRPILRLTGLGLTPSGYPRPAPCVTRWATRGADYVVRDR